MNKQITPVTKQQLILRSILSYSLNALFVFDIGFGYEMLPNPSTDNKPSNDSASGVLLTSCNTYLWEHTKHHHANVKGDNYKCTKQCI